MDLSIRRAGPDDVDLIRDILVEAARWLRESGRELWREDELGAAAIRRDIGAGHVFLAMVDGESAGTLKFELSDKDNWPDVSQEESAFIHRLAVRRKYSGGQVSSALMQWAIDRAAALGRSYLRLDCDHSRAKLRSVYERFGFRWHSDWQAGPYFVARYEYPIEPTAGVT